MAQEVVNKKVPPMMAAAMLGSQVRKIKKKTIFRFSSSFHSNSASDLTFGPIFQFVKTPKEQMSLKLRLHKMKESIITGKHTSLLLSLLLCKKKSSLRV